MDEKELRELLLQRLYLEYMLFKDSLLQTRKEDIFAASYKVEIFVNLYEILLAQAGDLRSDTIRGLIKLNFGILEFLYREWLDKEDGFYEELKGYACSELEALSVNGSRAGRKDGGDGKEFDQAA